MTAQHKPPYLRRLRFAADPLRPERRGFPVGWAGRVAVAASSLSFSRFRYRIVSLGERCRSSPFDSGGRSTTSTDADAVPSS
ncbi:hypothetical protein QYF36_007842 [Acer negundo]|nr:hypothetical protein Q3G72_018668 [Acer saccharum]KAK4837710.1 hypothetical protein QYF36_007842 [Acer negundo]